MENGPFIDDVDMYLFIYMCVCMYMCMYIYVHIYIYTYHGFWPISMLPCFVKRLFPDANTNNIFGRGTNAQREFKLQVDTPNADHPGSCH